MITATATLVCFAILAWSGAQHFRHLGAFKAAMESQRVWPRKYAMPLSVLVASIELSVGVFGLGGATLAPADLAVPILLGTAAGLYAIYAAYGIYLLKFRPGVPCGCSSHPEPLDALVVGRAVALLGVALGALMDPSSSGHLSPTEWVVVPMAAATYAVGLWCLPSALRTGQLLTAPRAML